MQQHGLFFAEKASIPDFLVFRFDFLATGASKNHHNPPIFLRKAVKPRRKRGAIQLPTNPTGFEGKLI